MTRKDLSTSCLALRRQGDLSATGYIPYVDRMRKLVDRWDVCGFRVASLSRSSASLFPSLPRSCHPRRRRGTYPFPRARRLSLPSRQAHPGNYLSLLLSSLSDRKSTRFRVIEAHQRAIGRVAAARRSLIHDCCDRLLPQPFPYDVMCVQCVGN